MSSFGLWFLFRVFDFGFGSCVSSLGCKFSGFCFGFQMLGFGFEAKILVLGLGFISLFYFGFWFWVLRFGFVAAWAQP